MRVLVIGATGAIGTRLLPQLRQAGHEVIGTSRSAAKAGQLRSLGAEPFVLDALDPDAVRRTFAASRPDAVIYQATALANLSDLKHFDRSFAPTNRLRTEGVDMMLAAAKEAGVSRIVAQRYASHRYARVGGPVKTEEDPLDPVPPHPEALAAMARTDEAVTKARGIALRYGSFYGDPVDPLVTAVRTRKFPVVGDGGGGLVFHPFGGRRLGHGARCRARGASHLQHRRRRTGPHPGVANRAGEDPGYPSAQHFPKFTARVFAGEVVVIMATQSAGAQRQGQGRAQLASSLLQLATGLRGHLRSGRPREAGRLRPDRNGGEPKRSLGTVGRRGWLAGRCLGAGRRSIWPWATATNGPRGARPRCRFRPAAQQCVRS